MRRVTALLAALVLTATAAADPAKWAASIDQITKGDAAHPPAKGGIVFVGSSSIRRWSTLEQDFPGMAVLNRGFGGSQLADSVFYADRIVLPYAPRAVVVYAGENDLQEGRTPAQVIAAYEALVAKVHAALPQARIVFIGLKPSPSRWRLAPQMQEVNAAVAQACAADPRRRFVDVWAPMLDAQGQPRAELFIQDKLHMTPAGYAIWTPLVAAQLR